MRATNGLLVAALAGVLSTGAAGAAETAGAAQAANATGDDRIICRKTAEVGSLVKRKKECFTKREWDQIAEAHQRGAKKLQDGLSERSITN
jgi:hypothetical protein